MLKTQSLGACWAPTSSWRPFGPAFCPLGLLTSSFGRSGRVMHRCIRPHICPCHLPPAPSPPLPCCCCKQMMMLIVVMNASYTNDYDRQDDDDCIVYK